MRTVHPHGLLDPRVDFIGVLEAVVGSARMSALSMVASDFEDARLDARNAFQLLDVGGREAVLLVGLARFPYDDLGDSRHDVSVQDALRCNLIFLPWGWLRRAAAGRRRKLSAVDRILKSFLLSS